jgi:hypothetical protein
VDTFSNILYVKEEKRKLSALAHACVEVDKYRPESCCVIGNYFSLKVGAGVEGKGAGALKGCWDPRDAVSSAIISHSRWGGKEVGGRRDYGLEGVTGCGGRGRTLAWKWASIGQSHAVSSEVSFHSGCGIE